MKPKVIVILGQTATGKSNLAVKIARKINGEIISADSRQVYRRLNIGTGKITKREMQDVPHHLLDVVNPKNKFTVVEFKKLAELKIKEILARGKTAIICGGTGFYIDAITKGIIFPEVAPNNKLRKKLALLDGRQLLLILKKLDPNRAKNIKEKNEQNNKVRLIRAIEIAKTLGKVPKITEARPQYKFIKIGLHLPTPKLQKKIEQRLLKRIKMGMIKEAQKLHEEGLSYKRMEELGLEYKFMALFLQNKINKEEMIEKLNTAILQYAKRQMTWFKRDPEIKWFNAPKNINLSALTYLKKML